MQVLSILIPIFNKKIIRLVDELIDQCKKAQIGFEIICLDDGSTDKIREHNRIINERFGVNYVELTTNVGRSRIRNRLSRLARYDWLLFLDCDVSIPRKNFIKTYLDCCSGQSVFVGGISYRKQPPQSQDKVFHWTYGRKREQVSARKRNQMPAAYLHSGNFLVARAVLMKIPFDEQLTEYGYEDLILGNKLHRAGISITHIDNPVVHLGLKGIDRFITDQEKAVRQLAIYYNTDKSVKTRLTRIYGILTKMGLMNLIYQYLEKKVNQYEKRLKNPPINLYYLDLCKLYYFVNELKTHKLKH